VNRPEFRELAPFEFTDIVGGRAVVGNPALQRALIQNADLRWEWFPSPREVFAVSAFLKDFDQPIERVVEPTAQLRTSYANAAGASNRGIEVEARRELTDELLLALNYTFVDSNIELPRTAGQVQTSAERPLAGQSRNLVNAILEARVPAWELTGRVLLNFFDDRIVDVGSLGLPDILEEGRSKLDVVLSKRVGRFGVRLTAENLTDAEVVFSQGGLPQRRFKVGRAVSLGVSYAFY
jgi:outer membrane receptor protein involved in Fe transport